MNEYLIQETKEYIKNIFNNNYDGHDYYHSIRVYEIATKIAIEEKANLFVVQLSALLHDIDDRKVLNNPNNDSVRDFLGKNNVPKTIIDDICNNINDVSFFGIDSVIPRTLEGKCVQDADRLDAIGAIGIARAFAFGGSNKRLIYDPKSEPIYNMNKEVYIKNNSSTINHFYEKLFLIKDMMNTKIGQTMALERDYYMRTFLDEFFAEWNCKK